MNGIPLFPHSHYDTANEDVDITARADILLEMGVKVFYGCFEDTDKLDLLRNHLEKKQGSSFNPSFKASAKSAYCCK